MMRWLWLKRYTLQANLNVKAGADVFNCLNLLENDTFIEALKFGRGDGNLHYYLYNYRAFDVTPAKTGLVMI